MPVNWIDGYATGDDLKGHEEEVGGEVSAKLDDGRLVVLVVEREGEYEPDGREDCKAEEKEKYLPSGPVAYAALPQLGRVRLHRRVGNDLGKRRRTYGYMAHSQKNLSHFKQRPFNSGN